MIESVLHPDLLAALPPGYRESPEFLSQFALASVRAALADCRISGVQYTGLGRWAFWREYQSEIAAEREANRIVYDPLIRAETTQREYDQRHADKAATAST